MENKEKDITPTESYSMMILRFNSDGTSEIITLDEYKKERDEKQ